MSHAITHRTNTPLSTRRRPARLALSLVEDPGSSGLIDVQNLCAEPPPPSLASVGPPPSAPRARPTAPWTAAIGGAVALSLMMLGGAAAWRSTDATMSEASIGTRGSLAIHEASRPAREGTLHLAARDDASGDRSSRRGTGVTAPALDDASDPSEALATEPASQTAPEQAEASQPEASSSAPPAEPRSTSRSNRKPTRPKPRPTTKPTKAPAAPASIPIECVLDPSRCDTSGRPAAPRANAPRPAPRPEKLSTLQLKRALADTKPQAQRCGLEHGVEPGTTVRVKLSIEGVTGSVLSAAAQGEHATGSLGRCVALALSRTQFPQFQASRMGTIYSIRM